MKISAHRNDGLRRRQSGFTLIEALVSAVVLAVGLLVIASFQGRVTTGSAEAKARGEAIHLAQQHIERLRNQELEGLVALQANPDNLDPPPNQLDPPHQGRLALYDVIWELEDTDPPAEGLRAATVTVSWQNSRNEDEEVVLSTLIAGSAYAGGIDPSAGSGTPVSSLQTPFGGGTIVSPGYTEDQMIRFKEAVEGAPSDFLDNFVEGPTAVEGAPVEEPSGGWPANIPSGAKKVVGFDVDEQGNVIALILVGIGDPMVVSREVVDLATGDTLVLLPGHEESSFRGMVYLRPDANSALSDIFVEGTPFALCVRGVATTTNEYDTQAFICYVAGGDAFNTFGWYGNIGVLQPEANNQEGVCIGAVGPSGAPLVEKTFRKYRGYRANEDAVLVQIGIEPKRHFKGHNILVASLSGNNTCTSQLANIETISSSHPFWKVEGDKDNPPDEFCFTRPDHPENQNPTLGEGRSCPDYVAPVSGPEGCSSIGDLCVASGQPYDDLVYIGNTETEWLFVAKTNQAGTFAWDAAQTECAVGAGWSQLPGPPVAGETDILGSLLDNKGLFVNRVDVDGVGEFVVSPAPTRYWTARSSNGNNRYFADFSNDTWGVLNRTNEHRVRCFYRMDIIP